LNVEFWPLVLEDLLTDFLMFGDTVRIELPSTPLPTLHKSRGIVLLDFFLLLVAIDFVVAVTISV